MRLEYWRPLGISISLIVAVYRMPDRLLAALCLGADDIYQTISNAHIQNNADHSVTMRGIGVGPFVNHFEKGAFWFAQFMNRSKSRFSRFNNKLIVA